MTRRSSRRPVAPRATATQRRERIAALLLEGLTEREIVRRLHTSPVTVRSDIDYLLNDWHSQTAVPVRQYRTLQLMRIREALKAVMPRVRDGNLKAVNEMVRLMEREARLLPGLDAPQPQPGTNGIAAGAAGMLFERLVSAMLEAGVDPQNTFAIMFEEIQAKQKMITAGSHDQSE
jgi:hypothetical protein